MRGCHFHLLLSTGFLFFFSTLQTPVTLCNLGVGATFGESILHDLPRDSTVVTKTTCELLRVEQQDFRLIWEVSCPFAFSCTWMLNGGLVLKFILISSCRNLYLTPGVCTAPNENSSQCENLWMNAKHRRSQLSLELSNAQVKPVPNAVQMQFRLCSHISDTASILLGIQITIPYLLTYLVYLIPDRHIKHNETWKRALLFSCYTFYKRNRKWTSAAAAVNLCQRHISYIPNALNRAQPTNRIPYNQSHAN